MRAFGRSMVEGLLSNLESFHLPIWKATPTLSILESKEFAVTQDPTPQEALAAIKAARSSVAPPPHYPIAYDLLYGAVCGLLVAGQGMPRPWSFIALPIAMAGLAFMVVSWRKHYGWWVSGFSPRRARWAAFGLGGVFLGLIALSLYGRVVGPDWLFLVSGGLGFVAAIVGSRIWMHLWRKELAEAPR